VRRLRAPAVGIEGWQARGRAGVTGWQPPPRRALGVIEEGAMSTGPPRWWLGIETCETAGAERSLGDGERRPVATLFASTRARPLE